MDHQEQIERIAQLYQEFIQLNSFEEQLNFFEIHKLNPGTNYLVHGKESPSLSLSPKNKEEEILRNKAKVDFHKKNSSHSLEAFKDNFYKQIHNSAIPEEYIQDEISACEEIISDMKMESFLHGYKDAIKGKEIDYTDNKLILNDQLLHLYIWGNSIAFFKQFLKDKLREIDTFRVEDDRIKLPYPILSDFESLAKNLKNEISLEVYNEIIRDWIAKYRMKRIEFTFRFPRYINEEYGGESKGKIYHIFKMWNEKYGRDFLGMESYFNSENSQILKTDNTQERQNAQSIKSIEINKDSIDEIYDLLKPLFTEENETKNIKSKDHSSPLKKVLQGKTIERKLLFKGYAAQLIHFFKKYHESGAILNSKAQLNKWICQSFLYTNRSTNIPIEFDEKNVHKMLGPNSPTPKNTIIPD